MILNSQDFGTGKAVVLFHGLFGSGDNLRAIARGLEDSYRVILPDLPNHGMSPHISSSTHEAMVDQLETFLDEIPGEPVIGGHSLGAKLAMLIALRNPERYPALISIDMAPREYEASHSDILSGLRAVPLSEISSRRDADEMLATAVPNAGVRSFLLKNLARTQSGFRWRLNLDAIIADYDGMLGWRPADSTYTHPALFVGGENSRYLQAERDRERILTWFPHARIEMIEDAGHWLHADKPAEVVAEIRAFLSQTVHP